MRARGYPGADVFVPEGVSSLAALAAAARGCRGCDLFERSTQVVFGAGRAQAQLMLIGEQPGDAEDKRGQPFVGPAGRVLDRALGEAGIASEAAYITNAVKHFRWRPEPGGTRRLHQRPDTWQVRACKPWLLAEIEQVNPRVLVTMGATAGQALFGSSFRVGLRRGQALPWSAREAGQGAATAERRVVPTIHPSAVLRADDRDAAYGELVSDLAVAACLL
jgi:uracil-DNA glycosylase